MTLFAGLDFHEIRLSRSQFWTSRVNIRNEHSGGRLDLARSSEGFPLGQSNSSLVSVMDLPPKDPHEEDDENEEDDGVTARKKRSQRSSENRTNVNTADGSVWLLSPLCPSLSFRYTQRLRSLRLKHVVLRDLRLSI